MNHLKPFICIKIFTQMWNCSISALCWSFYHQETVIIIITIKMFPFQPPLPPPFLNHETISLLRSDFSFYSWWK